MTILYNKLIRTDLLMAIAILLLFVVKGDFPRGVLQGFVAAVFLISIGNHIGHYKKTKRLY